MRGAPPQLLFALVGACHALAPPKVPRASATRAEPLASRFAADSWSWTQNWFPMAFAKVTDRTSPQRLELLGTALALWWDPVGERWSAMADLCPHRAAPLSEGRVDPAGQA